MNSRVDTTVGREAQAVEPYGALMNF